jgi:hypothetical protein
MSPESSRFHCFMGGTVLVFLASEWTLARLVHLQGLGHELSGAALRMAPLLAVALYCGWRKHRHLFEAAALCIWMVALTITLNVLIQICARSPARLVDKELANIDAALFFSVASVVQWLRPHRILRITL